MISHLLHIVVAFAVSALVVPVVRRVATLRGIGDHPGERKVNVRFIPRMGGVGIIVGTAAAVVLDATFGSRAIAGMPETTGIALSLGLIVALGAYDDVRGVGSLGKLSVQILAASFVITGGLMVHQIRVPFVDPIPLGILALPVTLLWLVGITNAVNLIDGLDGLAAGVSAVAAATFAVLGMYAGNDAVVVLSLALVGACGGFLVFNFHPATIFMGDTGSLFLGFFLATISLMLMSGSGGPSGLSSSLVLPVMVLAVPIVDTSIAFFRRIRKGMHPLKPDKEHIHHRLMDLGLTHRQTVVMTYTAAALLGTMALFTARLDAMYGLVLLVISFGAIYAGVRRLGYVEEMAARSGDPRPPIQPLSIARIIDRAFLLTGDTVALVAAFLISYWFRFHSGWLPPDGFVSLETYLISPGMLILVVGWLALFWLAGLYDIPWDVSRVDYVFSILKASIVGTAVLFVFTFDPDTPTFGGRVTALVYGATIASTVSLMRMAIVSFERHLQILGFRRRNTLIAGTLPSARDLLEEIRLRPGLQYGVVGFVERSPRSGTFEGYPVLGSYLDIPELVRRMNVEEILIVAGLESREEILDVVTRCDGIVPAVKVAATDAEVLSGFRTEEIVGHPLMRLFPLNMVRWQWGVKRLIDVAVSVVVLVPLLPVWAVVGLLIKLDSRGPILFRQERVGKKGRAFRLYKFRSMVTDAEKETGPVWATPDDKRVTRLGRFIRRYRIDEVPQFINVLKGEMSLVGPRPERPYFVDQLEREVVFYRRRLLVRPGITGWAQVKHRYDTSLDDVRKKITYDLYYLENMSLTLDLKIMLRTFFVALSGRGTH
ncbi:MAG: exopolysaccharide biosynthesis polyprenyl glycosylphosphotransferase [Bacteroidetes bacterium]|jgi:exopolysaccharide biosynthesis polyprenyl glycosylphosphotransferase|nr:exopolysaccharide biosynthesis polyprenyl glycosylphosphotransferase [Bacteroidota bacterium]